MSSFTVYTQRRTETIQITPLRIAFIPNPNAPVAASKGMQTVKLCSNKTSS